MIKMQLVYNDEDIEMCEKIIVIEQAESELWKQYHATNDRLEKISLIEQIQALTNQITLLVHDP